MLRTEECASNMEQRSNDAGVEDVQIKLSKEECVLGMEERSNAAV